MYYNNELKQKYISEQNNNSDVVKAKKIFEKAKIKEFATKSDLSRFDRNQVIEVINTFESIDLNALKSYVAAVYDYQSWYYDTQKESMPSTIAYNQKKITREDLDFITPIKKSIYPSFGSLMEELRLGVEFDQGHYVVPLVCMAWLGIDINESVLVPKSGVDFEMACIFDEQGKCLVENIPQDVLDVMYVYANTRVGKKGNATVYPFENGKFLRLMEPLGTNKTPEPFNRDDAKGQIYYAKKQINQKLKERVPPEESRLTYLSIQRSGQFDRLRRLELSGIDLNSSANENLIRKVYGPKNKTYDVIYIYQQYKKAFNLD